MAWYPCKILFNYIKMCQFFINKNLFNIKMNKTYLIFYLQGLNVQIMDTTFGKLQKWTHIKILIDGLNYQNKEKLFKEETKLTNLGMEIAIITLNYSLNYDLLKKTKIFIHIYFFIFFNFFYIINSKCLYFITLFETQKFKIWYFKSGFY